MKILGISGRERHAAAAVSVDGAIAAAAVEESFARILHIGYRHTGGYPIASIGACLSRAGLTLADVDRVIVVDDQRPDAAGRPADPDGDDRLFDGRGSLDGLDPARIERIAATTADAQQVVSGPGEAAPAVVLAAPRQPGDDTAGLQPLFCAMSRVASALGLRPADGYEAIENLGAECDSPDGRAFDAVIGWTAERGVTVRDDRLDAALAPARQGADGSADPSVNVRLQQDREAIAAGFCARVNAVVVEMLERAARLHDRRRVGLAGGLAASRGLLREVARTFGDRVVVAPVPEAVGRAIGAALPPDGPPALPVESLALGPEFSEQEIKVALENCRLDYLYEPDWPRLLGRVSRMLSRGTVVAWFQGPMGFGPRPAGTRAILCDPSNRYARENINRFLRHAALDDPLPVAMTPQAASGCLARPDASPFLVTTAHVKPDARDRVRAALDRREAIPVQLMTAAQCPELFALLELHRERSGVPGLIQTALAGAGEPPACTPRDAVRTAFSSAVDALVIGRFLLMKDYWLLRSGEDQ